MALLHVCKHVGHIENNRLKIQSEDDEVSEDLLKVDVQVFGMDFCNGSNSYVNLMQEGMFCAGDTDGKLFIYQHIIIYIIISGGCQKS